MIRTRYVKQRRGQIETPVVMMFAVVAGVLILLVIGYFVIRQQGSASSAAQLEALAQVRTSLTSLQGSVGVTQNLTLGGGPYQVRCGVENDGELSLHTEGADGDSVSLRGILLAAPEQISSDTLTVVTRPAGTAFRIGTMLYAFPVGTSIAIDPTLPGLPFPVASGGAPAPQIIHTFPDGTTMEITVKQDGTEPDAGTVTFETTPSETYPYIDTSLLGAAAVTGDPKLYTCVLDRYVQLLAFNNALQHRRLLELQAAALASGSSCYALYDDEAFKEIETILGSQTATAPTDLTRGEDLTESDAVAIAAALTRIEAMNGRLIRGDRCATVS